MEKETELREYRVLAVDVTHNYADAIPQNLAFFVKRVLEISVYDPSTHVYCAETTPSYAMHYLNERVECNDGTPEEVLDELDNLLCLAGEDCNVSYSHVGVVDALWEEQAKHGLAASKHIEVELPCTPEDFMFEVYEAERRSPSV